MIKFREVDFGVNISVSRLLMLSSHGKCIYNSPLVAVTNLKAFEFFLIENA